MLDRRTLTTRLFAIPWLLLAAGQAGGFPVVGGENEYVFRIFLSSTSPEPLPPIPNPGPENYADLPASPPEYVAQQNATATTSTRLWIWGRTEQMPYRNYWQEISLDVTADGPVALSNLTYLNPNYWYPSGESYNRWGAIYVPPAGGSAYINSYMAVGLDGHGLTQPPHYDGYRDAENNVLLGYVDATYTSGGVGTVWLALGGGGIGVFNAPELDFIYFGYGDARLPGDYDFHQRSTLPEAVFVPEPATIALAAALLFALRRRRAA